MSDMKIQRLPALANVDEVAAYLNVSPKTIYYWAERFEIPYQGRKAPTLQPGGSLNPLFY